MANSREVKVAIKKAQAELLKLAECGCDPEADHGRADDILCELLTIMGAEDVVKAFSAVNKYYG